MYKEQVKLLANLNFRTQLRKTNNLNMDFFVKGGG